MKLQSSKKVEVRGKVIGGEKPLVCLPLVAQDGTTLLEQAGDFMEMNPDLIEWRADSFTEAENLRDYIEAVMQLRQAVKDIPLIFTLRYFKEGGFREIPQETRLSIIKAVTGTGCVDLVDFELVNGKEMVAEIKETVQLNGKKLILSHHNFEMTPAESFIIEKLKEAQELGADIAKLAAMPTSSRDVLTLLSATLTARTEALDIPIITMAMGEIGAITRIAGGLFGSDVTFAIGRKASAPGQIPVAELRNMWQVLSF